jgi:hypothetical protein
LKHKPKNGFQLPHHANTAAATNATMAKPEFINRLASPVYVVAGAEETVAALLGGGGGTLVPALMTAGTVLLDTAMVGAGAIAVLVHPQLLSYQVYVVPGIPPVAAALAGIAEVLWQLHSGSKYVTVTVGSAAAEIRVAFGMTVGIIVVDIGVVVEDVTGAPTIIMELDEVELDIGMVGAAPPSAALTTKSGEKFEEPL